MNKKTIIILTILIIFVVFLGIKALTNDKEVKSAPVLSLSFLFGRRFLISSVAFLDDERGYLRTIAISLFISFYNPLLFMLIAYILYINVLVFSKNIYERL